MSKTRGKRKGKYKMMAVRAAEADFLHDAVLGNIENLKKSLRFINTARTDEGRSALHLAISARQREAALFLIQNGARVNATDDDGILALHCAAQLYQETVVDALLAAGNTTHVNAASKYSGITPLIACLHGEENESHPQRLSIMRKFIALGADINHREILRGHTPLIEAVNLHAYDALDLLLEKKADPNIHDNAGDTPLHHAACLHRLTALQKLIAHSDVTRRNRRGETALFIIVDSAHISNAIELAEILITKNKAVVNIGDQKGMTPLHRAAQDGYTMMCSLLLNHGANVNAINAHGDTALHLAIMHGSINTIRELLAFNANVDTANHVGDTPLHLAAAKGNREIVDLLLSYKPKVEVRNHDRTSPLYCAAERGHLSIVKTLLAHDANVHQMLHAACRHGNIDVMRLSLELGASTAVKNRHGQVALYTAVKNGHLAIIDELLPLYIKTQKDPKNIYYLLPPHFKRKLYNAIANIKNPARRKQWCEEALNGEKLGFIFYLARLSTQPSEKKSWLKEVKKLLVSTQKEIALLSREDSVELIDGTSPIIRSPRRNSLFVDPELSPRHVELSKGKEDIEKEPTPQKFSQ